MLVECLVYAAWLCCLARHAFRKMEARVVAVLCRPFEGLPVAVEMLDSGQPERGRVSALAVCLRNPVALLLGRLASSDARRRAWLERKIRHLPCGSDISYVFHYRVGAGASQSILTRDPRRGLRPVPEKRTGPRAWKVLAAYHGEEDVTRDIDLISATFTDPGTKVCPWALDAYLRHRRGLSLTTAPVVITDTTLVQRVYTAPRDGPGGKRGSWANN